MIFEDDKVPSYFVRTREAGYDEDQYNENDQEYDFDDDSIAFETEANQTLTEIMFLNWITWRN